MLLAQGDAAGALEAYRALLATAERLAAGDPTNASWQRDLSVSHEKVGDALLAQGDLAGALRAYRNSLAIRERLAAGDPTNASWQHDLAVTHVRMGDVLLRQGDAAEAALAYGSALTTFRHLVDLNPANPDWQMGLGDAAVKARVARGPWLARSLYLLPDWGKIGVVLMFALALVGVSFLLGRLSSWFWVLGVPLCILAVTIAASTILMTIRRTRQRLIMWLKRQLSQGM